MQEMFQGNLSDSWEECKGQGRSAGLSRQGKAPSQINEETEVLQAEDGAVAFVKLQKEKGIDLIVIASHGKTGILKNLMGSVVDKVMKRAKCQVLLVRS